MSDRDYYEVFGLTPGADGAMVDQAYWHLARKYQALATTNALGHRMLDEINEAYGVLGNARLREQYDGFRDDVLVGGGIIKPVRSKPKRSGRRRRCPRATARRRSLPELAPERNWRSYAVVALFAVIAVAGAAGARTGQRHRRLGCRRSGAVADADARAPAPGDEHNDAERPRMPRCRRCRPCRCRRSRFRRSRLPKARCRCRPCHRCRSCRTGIWRPEKDEPYDTDELRASTAAIIARWRKSIGLPRAGADRYRWRWRPRRRAEQRAGRHRRIGARDHGVRQRAARRRDRHPARLRKPRAPNTRYGTTDGAMGFPERRNGALGAIRAQGATSRQQLHQSVSSRYCSRSARGGADVADRSAESPESQFAL